MLSNYNLLTTADAVKEGTMVMMMMMVMVMMVIILLMIMLGLLKQML